MTFVGDLSETIATLLWVGALLTVPSVLLQRTGRPTAALSWLLALFVIPSLAVVAWWLFGRTHLRRKSRRRRRASRTIAQSLSRTHQQLFKGARAAAAIVRPTSRLAPCLPPGLSDAVFPATTGGNRVELLSHAAAAHQAWHRLIEGAEHHLHLLFYIWRDDNTGRALRDILIEKAARGVEVRVLYDAIGSLGLPKGFFDPLRSAQGQVAEFMPIRLLSATPTLNFRNHRKVLIADGRSACTGGINVGDEYLGWQDIGITVRGPGVNQLQEVFVDDWHFTTAEELTGNDYFCELPDSSGAGPLEGAICETIASGPDQAFNATRDMVFMAVTQCRRRLWIATPYFVPDIALLLALRTAVYRGVDLRLLVPAHNDAWLVRRASRVFYPELLEGGVKIYEYQGMLHAKAMLLDDDAVLIGSANLDTRSFRLNFELSTFVIDAQLNRDLAGLLEAVQADSTRVALHDVRRVSPLVRLHDAVAHLLSPLL